LKSGDVEFYQVKSVVKPEEVRIVSESEEEPAVVPAQEDENELPRYNPDRHIFLEEAKKVKKDVESGEEIEFPLEVHADFGRIAAQTAKQVVLQNLRGRTLFYQGRICR
jgi:hypothetical protein